MSKAILIVDDDPGTLRMFSLALVPSYDTVCADNGHDAYEMMLAMETPPDLALLDLSMPGMDGLDLAKAIRGKYPTIPIAFLSAHQVPAEYADVASVDPIGVWLKPITPTDLRRKILEVLKD